MVEKKVLIFLPHFSCVFFGYYVYSLFYNNMKIYHVLLINYKIVVSRFVDRIKVNCDPLVLYFFSMLCVRVSMSHIIIKLYILVKPFVDFITIKVILTYPIWKYPSNFLEPFYFIFI